MSQKSQHDLKAELVSALANAVAEGRDSLAQHPAPEVLSSYDQGTLPPSEAEAVEEHLVVCRECQGLLLDAGSFGDPDFGSEASETEMAAAWRSLKVEATQRSRANAEPGSRYSGQPLLAAGLAALSLGLSAWIGLLYRERDRPHLNTPVYELMPSDAARSLAEQPRDLDISDGAPSFNLTLNLPEWHDRQTELAVRIVAADGRIIFESEGLTLLSDGVFGLSLPTPLMAEGLYNVELAAPGSDGAPPIARYRFRIPNTSDRE